MAYKAYVGYTSYGTPINVQVTIVDTSNNSMYDNATIVIGPSDLVAYTPAEFQAAILTNLLAYSAIQGYGLTANDIIWIDTASAPLPKVFNYPSRSLSTAFQISATRDAQVAYSIRIANVLTLSGGAANDIVLQYADNSGFTTNVVEASRAGNSNTGGLVVGLTLNDAICVPIMGIIPAGKYVRLVPANVTGTPTNTVVRSQEVLI